MESSPTPPPPKHPARVITAVIAIAASGRVTLADGIACLSQWGYIALSQIRDGRRRVVTSKFQCPPDANCPCEEDIEEGCDAPPYRQLRRTSQIKRDCSDPLVIADGGA
ncbi:MAG: hypothetical protein QF448_00820 [Candidatus Thalassarchaeaceae archaeon]|nr:hypothetical protein [Candidatus Thalassarchaeaceae archaeon]